MSAACWWRTQVPATREKRARSLLHPLTRGEDYGETLTVNPYNGCSHRCVYCYASYEWIPEFFDTIEPKVNAPDVLERELQRWRAATIPPVFIASATDGYQSHEARYRLTRRCIEVLQRYDVPYYIFTKSSSIVRDLALHARYRDRCLLVWSLTTLDEDLKRQLEPYAASARGILTALRRAAEAGIPTGVNADPILPGLTDRAEQLGAVVEAAVSAGARFIGSGVLRLRDDIWRRLHNLLVAIRRPDALRRMRELYFHTPRQFDGYFRAPPDYIDGVTGEARDRTNALGATYGFPVDHDDLATVACAGFVLRPARRYSAVTLPTLTDAPIIPESQEGNTLSHRLP